MSSSWRNLSAEKKSVLWMVGERWLTQPPAKLGAMSHSERIMRWSGKSAQWGYRTMFGFGNVLTTRRWTVRRNNLQEIWSPTDMKTGRTRLLVEMRRRWTASLKCAENDEKRNTKTANPDAMRVPIFINALEAKPRKQIPRDRMVII